MRSTDAGSVMTGLTGVTFGFATVAFIVWITMRCGLSIETTWTKAIRVPSGDHTGDQSRPLVNRLSPVPSTDTT